MTIIIHSHF